MSRHFRCFRALIAYAAVLPTLGPTHNNPVERPQPEIAPYFQRDGQYGRFHHRA